MTEKIVEKLALTDHIFSLGFFEALKIGFFGGSMTTLDVEIHFIQRELIVGEFCLLL